MKYLNLILLLLCFNAYGQDWITDKDFDNKINERSAFGDDQTLPVVIEFWAEFNDGNKFVAVSYTHLTLPTNREV